MKEKRKKIATNIPEELLLTATQLTGLNQTDAIIAGLKELIKCSKRRQLLDAEGMLEVDFDVEKMRKRKH